MGICAAGFPGEGYPEDTEYLLGATGGALAGAAMPFIHFMAVVHYLGAGKVVTRAVNSIHYLMGGQWRQDRRRQEYERVRAVLTAAAGSAFGRLKIVSEVREL